MCRGGEKRGSHRGCTARSPLTACLPQGPRGGCERGPRCRCRCRPPRRAARSMPLSPAGSKHESPESPPPEPPPPPERQPRASAGEPGSGLREETRLDPIRGPAGPRSPKLAAPARMEEPAPGAIVVRIGIPDLQQTVSARPATTRTAPHRSQPRTASHRSRPRTSPHLSRPRPTLRLTPHRRAPHPSPTPLSDAARQTSLCRGRVRGRRDGFRCCCAAGAAAFPRFPPPRSRCSRSSAGTHTAAANPFPAALRGRQRTASCPGRGHGAGGGRGHSSDTGCAAGTGRVLRCYGAGDGDGWCGVPRCGDGSAAGRVGACHRTGAEVAPGIELCAMGS